MLEVVFGCRNRLKPSTPAILRDQVRTHYTLTSHSQQPDD